MIAPLLFGCLIVGRPQEFFGIRSVDESTGRGIPLVTLETVNKQRFLSDSAGLIAFDEPGLMEKKVFFLVSSPGYEYPKDGFGYAGFSAFTRAGTIQTIKLKRVNIAERLCRLTGQGIYRDSELLGQTAPISDPVLNGGVMGQDTAQAELYKGKMYWFWGTPIERTTHSAISMPREPSLPCPPVIWTREQESSSDTFKMDTDSSARW